MGNQGKIVGNSEVCIGFQSQLILPELINILDFSHTFSVIRQYKNCIVQKMYGRNQVFEILIMDFYALQI